jgi:integrase
VGSLPIRSVTAAHLLEIIRRIEGRGAETVALLVRQWSSAIFRYAVATLRADSDPAAALKGAIHRPKVEHHKPLSRSQIVDFTKALERYGGYRTLSRHFGMEISRSLSKQYLIRRSGAKHSSGM